jgi:D-alanine-D-alanine ligase-like ATP-grasp enzyme
MNIGNLVLGERYSEHSKEFVFIGEKVDGKVTEIESCDMVFLENDFSTIGEVNKDFQLYEMKNLNHDIISHSIDDLKKTLNPQENIARS